MKKAELTEKKSIFHTIRCIGKEFTNEEWSEYCSESHKDPSKRIITSIGKYDFNDFDICLNPSVLTIATKTGAYGYYVTLEWCDCGNGLWSYGLSYNAGTGGGGFGCSWADLSGNTKSYRKGYPSEKEAIIAACDEAIRWLKSSGDKDGYNIKRLIEMIEDHKKSLSCPKPVQLELFTF